jgi:DnaJ-class molecular chaperone
MGGPGARTMSKTRCGHVRDATIRSRLLPTFFGGGGGRRRRPRARRAPRSQKGATSSREAELTLEEAYPLRDAAHLDHDRRAGAQRGRTRIPAGVKDGSRVRAAGEGEPGSNGGAAGDLFLRVHIRTHPVFERKGDDLYTKVSLPVTTAVLGGEAQVPTISGSVRLRVPETTQPGQIFRLKGHGMPIVGKADARGDLYATADVQLPRTLTKEQRQAWEQLKKSDASKQ